MDDVLNKLFLERYKILVEKLDLTKATTLKVVSALETHLTGVYSLPIVREEFPIDAVINPAHFYSALVPKLLSDENYNLPVCSGWEDLTKRYLGHEVRIGNLWVPVAGNSEFLSLFNKTMKISHGLCPGCSVMAHAQISALRVNTLGQ